jgi:CubicO group peptidase (beta-lactamase class C family)
MCSEDELRKSRAQYAQANLLGVGVNFVNEKSNKWCSELTLCTMWCTGIIAETPAIGSATVQPGNMKPFSSKCCRSVPVLCAVPILCIATWSQVPKPVPQVKISSPAPKPWQSAPEMTAADVGAFLDGLVPQQLKREDIAGAVVVIVKDGNILFSRGYGFADVKKRIPVTPEGTLFRPGSISKTFTWTAIMQLVEQGKINLDSDVNAYLDFQIPHTFDRPVTVRNLMTHTPGFEEVIKDLMVDRPDQLPQLQPFVIAHRPNEIYAPGTIPAYSNYGADLAGYIVQRVSGVPFEEYIQTNIFKPLGITHGTFREPLPDSLKPMMSNGYEVASEDAKPFELVVPVPAPDGSLSISGADMAPFMIAHLQNGKYGDIRILQEQTAQAMHTRQFAMDPAVNGMALGFYQENRNGLQIIGHGGDLNYMHSDMHLVLDKGLGFFVSYNSSGKGELDARTALWREFLDRYFPFTEANPQADPSQTNNSVAGKYLSSRRAQTSILRSLWWVLAEASVSQNSDGTIQVDSMKDFAGHPKKWRDIGKGQFREVNGQQLLVFKPDASGNMQMITEDPIEIEQRVGWTENKTFVTFVLGFAAALFALTLLFWPVAALVRRHYKQKLTLTPAQRKLRLWVRVSCAIELVALVAFAAFVMYGFSNLTVFGDPFDFLVRIIQVIFVIGMLAAVGTIYACYRLWRTPTGFWSRLYTGGLVLASVIFLWFTAVSRIVQSSLKY